MADLEQYIHSYFGIEADDMSSISSLFKTEHLKKGDYFLKAGKHCNQLSFIRSGIFRIYAIADGKEVTQWISTKDYFITELSSLIFDSPARFSIQAIADCELYTISKTDYNQIGKLVSQWDKLEKLFIAKCFTILEDRIFTHLSMSAEKRYEVFFQKNKALFNEVPLQYLASMLGMTPETFSRIRKKGLS
jgi:CRP/FNR family transcriptional regulator, anaerobic regulatory protein